MSDNEENRSEITDNAWYGTVMNQSWKLAVGRIFTYRYFGFIKTKTLEAT